MRPLPLGLPRRESRAPSSQGIRRTRSRPPSAFLGRDGRCSRQGRAVPTPTIGQHNAQQSRPGWHGALSSVGTRRELSVVPSVTATPLGAGTHARGLGGACASSSCGWAGEGRSLSFVPSFPRFLSPLLCPPPLPGTPSVPATAPQRSSWCWSAGRGLSRPPPPRCSAPRGQGAARFVHCCVPSTEPGLSVASPRDRVVGPRHSFHPSFIRSLEPASSCHGAEPSDHSYS